MFGPTGTGGYVRATSPTIASPTLTGTVTASAANFSGTVNHTGPFQISGVAQTFPTSGLIVGTTDTQSLTNKNITASTDVLGGVTMTLGSDANGDMYCRSGGVLTRIGSGAAASLLTSGGAGVCPTWVAAPGGGNVSNTGTPTANQIAQWTNATTIQGVNIASLHTAGNGIAITGTTNATIAVNLSTLTNSLGADVAMNVANTFFDGPSAAQGATGTWLATGTVTITDSQEAQT